MEVVAARSAVRRFVCWMVLAAFAGAAAAQSIAPGAAWLDDRGLPIQAHGGGITSWRGFYYWFGEDRSRTNDPARRYVACYRSRDLVHWQFRGQVLDLADPEHLGPGWVLERPKVFARAGKFVMYAHLDDGAYKVARVAVFTSDRIDGAYQFVRSFRPLGQESRDIGQFVDDDGQAYLIFESRPTGGFFIARLSDDGLDVPKQVSFLHEPLEGGALVHVGARYYVIGSHLSGWAPNPNVVASAPSLEGPWSGWRPIAPPEARTYGAQSSMLLKVAGTKKTTVIFMGDVWKPEALWDSRYLWMPMEVNDGALTLPPPHPWTLDIQTGETAIEK